MTPDDYLPLSGLQHLLFCERQCALIHVDQLWAENQRTEEGRLHHRVSDEAGSEVRPGRVQVWGLRVQSSTLALAGIADLVEYQRIDGICSVRAVELPGRSGRWTPLPVEHKRGRPKKGPHDRVQLCAQAICLEEMHGVTIDMGALSYRATKRRIHVNLDDGLRELTRDAAKRFHELVASGEIPHPSFGPHCNACSLVDECLPTLARGASIRTWLESVLRDEQR